MTALDRIAAILGPQGFAGGSDMDRWTRDWTGSYPSTPLAVARPATTAEVAQVMAIANAEGMPVVPASGLTGLNGGTQARDALVLSVDRLNRIRDIRAQGRTATVEAGVILANLHTAVDAHDLIFPLTFGARGSCMIGGVLSTNAGGSNVLRYGNTRDLVMGIEVVLADGRVMDLMSELHKDNSGYALRHLFIGAEGTLGIITAAVLKLKPKPRAYATAMLAVPKVADALALLNRLQDATGGAVEAFEYMPRSYIDGYLRHIPGAKPPFDQLYDVNIMVELGVTAPRDATPGPDGTVPITALLESLLQDMLEEGTLIDAVIATSEAQRREIWHRREVAGQFSYKVHPLVDTDVAVPLDRVADFLDRILPAIRELDPGAEELAVGHLGDGNIHYTSFPTRDDPALSEAIRERIEDVVADLGGSFSAEHGIGQSKLGTMRRRKDPVALDTMRTLKAALDPKGILNPVKVIPAPD
jgi:FAD/FMN-containing dehydrogenase